MTIEERLSTMDRQLVSVVRMLAAVPGVVDLDLAATLTSHRPDVVAEALESFAACGLATTAGDGRWEVDENVRLHLLAAGDFAEGELAARRRDVGCALLSRMRVADALGVLSASAYAFRQLGDVVGAARSEVERAHAHLLDADPEAARIALNAAEVPIATLGALEVRGRWAEVRADLAAVDGDPGTEMEFLTMARGFYEAAGDPRAARVRTTPAADLVGEE